MKNVVLLGATGSIGDNTLAVLRKFSDQFKLFGIVAHHNIEKIIPIIKEFEPILICLTDEKAAKECKEILPNFEIKSGMVNSFTTDDLRIFVIKSDNTGLRLSNTYLN